MPGLPDACRTAYEPWSKHRVIRGVWELYKVRVKGLVGGI